LDSSAVFESKPDFANDLEMRDFAVLNVAAGLQNFEPAYLTQRTGSAGDSVLDRVLNAVLRGTCDFDDTVDMVGH
jgi:hypothetical protein